MLPSASTPRLPDPAAPAANKITLASFVLSLSDTVTVVATVAVSAFPVTAPVKAPTNPVAVILPVLGLYVMLPSASTPRLPDPAAPAANKITLFSFVLSLSETVTVVAIDAVPVTLPVKAPAKRVAVSNPVLLLNVKLDPLLTD